MLPEVPGRTEHRGVNSTQRYVHLESDRGPAAAMDAMW